MLSGWTKDFTVRVLRESLELHKSIKNKIFKKLSTASGKLRGCRCHHGPTLKPPLDVITYNRIPRLS